MDKYAVIMAGGTGSRLWPLSQNSRPKQYICLSGEKSLLQLTLERLDGILEEENRFVVTSLQQQNLVQEALGSFPPPPHLILEPFGRNTAACIALAAITLERMYGDVVLCLLPSIFGTAGCSLRRPVCFWKISVKTFPFTTPSCKLPQH